LRHSSERRNMNLSSMFYLTSEILARIATLLSFHKHGDFDYLPSVTTLYNLLIGKTKTEKWTCQAFHSDFITNRLSLQNVDRIAVLKGIYDAKFWSGLENSVWWKEGDKGFDSIYYNEVCFRALIYGWVARTVALGFDSKDGSSEMMFMCVMRDLFDGNFAKELEFDDPILSGIINAVHHLYMHAAFEGDHFDPKITAPFFGEREVEIIRKFRAGF